MKRGILCAVALVAASAASAGATVIEYIKTGHVAGAAIDFGSGRTASEEFGSPDPLPFDQKAQTSLTLPDGAGAGVAHAALVSTTGSNLISAAGQSSASGFLTENVRDATIGGVVTFIARWTLASDTQLLVSALATADPSDPPAGGTIAGLQNVTTGQSYFNLRNTGSANLDQIFPAGEYLLTGIAYSSIKGGAFPQQERAMSFNLSVRVVPAPGVTTIAAAGGLLLFRRRRR